MEQHQTVCAILVRSLLPCAKGILSWARCFLFIFPCVQMFSAEESFLLIDGVTSETVCSLGVNIYRRVHPCSTFKIALSLMGFDAGILKDVTTPTWNFQEGYENYLEVWKVPQTPRSWMKYSCVWYSQLLRSQLGLEKVQSYLESFEYGKQEMSRGVTEEWLRSCLKISPKEQVDFIRKMVQGSLPVSKHACQMTKDILFLEELNGWKLFGKTGWGGPVGDSNGKSLEIAWFVGWVEKDDVFFPFAYNIREKNINLERRMPRVKQLLGKANLLNVSLLKARDSYPSEQLQGQSIRKNPK